MERASPTARAPRALQGRVLLEATHLRALALRGDAPPERAAPPATGDLVA